MLKLVLLAQIATAGATWWAPEVAPGDRFAWDMQGPGLTLVQSYRYEVEVDGERLTDPLKDVACIPSAVRPGRFECTAPIPISVGPHTLRVRSVDTTLPGMPAIEGAWSAVFPYVMRLPAAPSQLRAVPSAPGQLRPVRPKGTP